MQNDISSRASSEHVTIPAPTKPASDWHQNGYGQQLIPAPTLADYAQSQHSGLAYLRAKFKGLSDFDRNKQMRRFERIFIKTVNKFPYDAVKLMVRYWQSKASKRHEMVPRLIITTVIETSNELDTEAPSVAGVNQDGTAMIFSEPLLFAPDKVLEEVIAHELCHVYFLAGGKRPAVGVISETVRESYHRDDWEEEQAVRTQIAKLGFMDELLDIWKTAVDQKKAKWKKLYTTHIASLKKNPR